jgi:hypothetical protein
MSERGVADQLHHNLRALSSGDHDLRGVTEETWGDTAVDFLQAVKHGALPDLREKEAQSEWRMDMAQRWWVLVLLGGRVPKSGGEPANGLID